MIRIDIDDSTFRKRKALVMNNRLKAREQALRVLSERFITYIVNNAPKDTNRFVRAYQQAGNDLGLGPYVVAPVLPGRFQANVRRLQNQVFKWDYIVSRYEREGRTMYKGVKKNGPDKGYVKAKALRDRAVEELNKLLEAGEGSGAIVMGGSKKAKGVKRLATVRTQVYGGEGRWLVGPNTTAARIHNKEPHASIVDRNTRVVSNGMRAVRRFGGQRVSEKYLREAAKGTPWLARQLAA